MIEESRLIETIEIDNINKKIKEIEEEIDTLKKKKSNYTHAKDILAAENDKKTLKKLSDDVEAIEFRLKYMESPEQIYDEIEMNIRALDGEEKIEKKEEKKIEKDEDYVDLDDFRIQDILDQQEQLPIEQEEKQEESVIDFPPRNKEINKQDEERLKVVQVEELTPTPSIENEKPESEVLDFSILDEPTVNNDDYISFNDILNKEDNND